MKLRKGDLVEVIAGDEKGRRGKVLEIQVSKKTGKTRVVVEGINMHKKHQRTTRADKPGGIVDLPGAVDASNLALMCPKCGKRSKVRREKHGERRVRVCRECDEIIDV